MKKGRFAKTILACMLTFLVLFTTTCLIMGFMVQFEPSTLIVSVFGFCGIEGGLLAWIKVTKTESASKKSSKDKEE